MPKIKEEVAVSQNAKKRADEETVEQKPKETTVEFLASLAGVLVTGLFIITFVLQAFEIPSSSMENTLLIGDHVFVNREQFAPPTRWMGPMMPYRDVRRNDIVVFLSPEEQGLFVVKRIIGVPGDHIHLRDGGVYRNGEKLIEPYVQHKHLAAWVPRGPPSSLWRSAAWGCPACTGRPKRRPAWPPFTRSEEHTSELQSLRHLVCRLLL